MELPDVPLFRGLTADEAEAAVTALRMRRRAFAKGEILLEAGQRAPALGVVLGVGATLLQQRFGLIEIPAETFLTKSYPVEFRPGDLAAVLAAFGAVACVISNITVRSMIKSNVKL